MPINPVSRIIDYQSLQDAMADELDRSDIAVQVPLFIQMFEAEVERRLRVRQMLCKGQSVGWRNSPFVPMPDDFLEARNVTVVHGTPNPSDPTALVDGNQFQATYQPPGVLDQLKEDNPQFSPRLQHHFTFFENTIEIYPDLSQLDIQYRVDLEYYGKVPRMGDQNPLYDPANPEEEPEFIITNWLLESAPDIYFYGSLVHSAPYLRDDARIALWSKMMNDGLMQLEVASEKALTRGSRLTRKATVTMG